MNRKKAASIRKGISLARKDIIFLNQLLRVENAEMANTLLNAYLEIALVPVDRVAALAYERTMDKESARIKHLTDEVSKLAQEGKAQHGSFD